MASLADHSTTRLVKGLLLGDGGAGKTSSLVSLVEAGYNLLIYDFDNLLIPLKKLLQSRCPERLAQVHVQTFTDKLKGVDTPVVLNGAALKVMPNVNGTPKAYASAMKQLNKWVDEGEEYEPPALGEEWVVVIDSLTSAATAAFRYVQAMNPMAKEPQTYYFGAQQLIMNLIQLLCSEDFATHVLVLAHLNYEKDQYEITKGFPKSIGSALNTQIATSFNTALLVATEGSKRIIRTQSTGVVDLKNPAVFTGLGDRLAADSGLAEYFRAFNAD